MTGKNSKQERDFNRIQKKALLRIASRTDNIDELLYPHQPVDDRHPHTQEVILLAEERGWNQEKIATSCGVSQPVVSGWKHGDGKATLQQIMPLIRQLSPTGPGHEFYACNIVDKVSLTLPENWEIQMLAKRARCSPNALQTALWDNIQQEVIEEFEQQEQLLQEEHLRLDKFIQQVSETQPLMEQELEENKNVEEEYQRAVAKLLNDNPTYAQLDEESQQLLVSNKLASPELNNRHQNRFSGLKTKILDLYPQLTEQNLLAELEQQKNDVVEKLAAFQAERDEAVTTALQQRSPLNKFEQSAFPLTIEKNLQGELKEAEITKLCEMIFKQQKHYAINVEVETQDYWDRYKKINIDEPAQELFEQYVNSLIFDIKTEEIHLCGRYVLSTPTTVDDDYSHGGEPSLAKQEPWFKKEVGETGYTLDLFCLHSQRLALVHGTYQYDHKKHFFVLKEFATLDALLEYVKPILNEEEQQNWKQHLMEMGYTTSTARVVY
ncbi:hypothetical protein H2O73_19715 [Vibrio sp. 404]|uniref:Helix-turn-helix domain-containing protein n=1 Tax=Vibrio marinisediminis TaxID=2758441 RepID=A0A7W2FUQ4_9VIBR|nr:hypothetical protein [Vibrio marinisediminis]MBA5764591.1 hypothetical protein [Vibrio marinisediminis]